MSRVMCRRGLPRGAMSRPFFPAEVIAVLPPHDTKYVYVELDAEGSVTASGESGSEGSAHMVAAARLAPDVAACGASLSCAVAPRGALRLRIDRDLPPHHELALWFDEQLLALLEMPFLSLRNIRGRDDYACHECTASFERPNRLKVHLFLSCAPFSPRAFWRSFSMRFRPPMPPSTSMPPVLSIGPAELEALATEWGRSRGGHLCVYCGKAYSRKYGLKIHIRTHTGYRPLRCRFCLRAFGDPSNLNKHVRLHAHAHSHAHAKAHQCALCGKVVARRRDLERHARTHTPLDQLPT